MEDRWIGSFGPAVNWRSFRSAVETLDSEMCCSLEKLSELARKIPLDVWGTILLDPETHMPVSGSALPMMPSEQVQEGWTGSYGGTLLRQSLAFIRCLLQPPDLAC